MSDPRHTGQTVLFLGLDSRMAIALVMVLYAPFSIGSWIIAIGTAAGLWFLRRAGYTVPAALRRLRMLVIGSRRPRLVGRRHPRLGP